MASLWFHLQYTDVYVNFPSFEKAYYLGVSLFPKSPSFLYSVEHLMTHSTSFIGSDNELQLYIYYGSSSPPLREEWFPNGILKMTVEELVHHDEFMKRKNKEKRIDFITELCS